MSESTTFDHDNISAFLDELEARIVTVRDSL